MRNFNSFSVFSTPRSRFLATLKRAFHLAHLANQKKNAPPVDELVGLSHQLIWNRRRFLKTSMATGAALLVGRSLPAITLANSNQATLPKIVIVGAGLAGLNAAYTLQKAGLHAEIYEAMTRPGGRIYTLKEVLGPGFTTELGGEFIDTNHTEMHALVKEFQLPLRDLGAPSEANLDEAYFFGGKLRSESEIVTALRPLVARIEADYNSLSDIVDFQHANRSAVKLDNLSLAEYLEQIGASGWLLKLLEVIYVVEYGLDCDQQSALNFIDMAAPGLLDTQFNVWGESDTRYQVKGGNEKIIEALAKQLERSIHLQYRLEAIRSKGTGFRLTFQNPNGNAVDIEADIVILTLPFSVLRQVDLQIELPAFKKKAIAELGYGTITKMMVGINQRLWRDQGYNGNVFTEDSFQQAYDNTHQQAGQGGGITFYVGGRTGLHTGNNPQLERKDFLSQLEKVFPKITAQYNDRTLFWNWPTFPFALGAYSCYQPGQWTTIAGAESKPVNHLFFAGEHCSQEFQGYMNGAAETGKRVAKQIIAALV